MSDTMSCPFQEDFDMEEVSTGKTGGMDSYKVTGKNVINACYTQPSNHDPKVLAKKLG